MKIYLIRHGETKGNREHRYVGTTDEGLLPEAVRALQERKAPKAARVYASPLCRCRETARILFPDREPVLIDDLRECAFGEFEYKNYAELNTDPDYQRFIDTMGESGFPGGEDLRSFQERCVRGFLEVLRLEDGERKACEGKQEQLWKEREKQESGQQDIALVVHGGTIMAILDRFSEPHRDYYDWQVKNGCGYEALVECREDGSLLLTDVCEWK